MNPLSPNILVLVDQMRIEKTRIASFLQTDPFPGGHKYELRITDIDSKKWFGVPSGEYEGLDRQYWTRFSISLNLLIGDRQTDGMSTEASYFLNSIDHLVVTPNSIRLTGICSMVGKG